MSQQRKQTKRNLSCLLFAAKFHCIGIWCNFTFAEKLIKMSVENEFNQRNEMMMKIDERILWTEKSYIDEK